MSSHGDFWVLSCRVAIVEEITLENMQRVGQLFPDWTSPRAPASCVSLTIQHSFDCPKEVSNNRSEVNLGMSSSHIGSQQLCANGPHLLENRKGGYRSPQTFEGGKEELEGGACWCLDSSCATFKVICCIEEGGESRNLGRWRKWEEAWGEELRSESHWDLRRLWKISGDDESWIQPIMMSCSMSKGG